MLKKFLGYLPHLSVLIIILGIIKQVIYFNYFKIPIQYFLGLPEIGLIVSSDLLIIAPTVFLMFLIAIGEKTIFSKPEKIEPEVTLEERKKNAKTLIIYLSILIVVSTVMLFLDIHYSLKITFRISIGLSATMIILLLYLPRFKDVLSDKEAKIAFIFSFLLIVGIIFKTANDIEAAKEGKYKGTRIYTADSIYTSTDSSFFIGKTEKYIFIYNEKRKTSRIIPSESVKMIDMQSK